MMLRSSSTPVLGSLLSSSSSLHISSECSNHHHHSSPNPDLHSFSCHLSPTSDGFRDQSPSLGIRRSRSDGNLLSFLSDRHPPSPKCPSQLPHTTLETILSFSVYIRKTLAEEEAAEEEDDDENDGQRVDGGFDFASENRTGSASIGGPPPPPPLFLARGLGIDRIGSGLLTAGGGGGVGICDVPMGNGGEQSDVEMHYKRMVEENPSNALFLRNYAEFLYQAKGDIKRAEEYYSRAILADPDDGESLSQYARLVWELHQDEERASSYFQQAVQAAPHDSHVLAAYAEFLWYTEEDDDGEGGAEGDGSQNSTM
ncbi:uncharacterized protein LOC135611708 [Musa acuminata AAA Group]|uniref:uncharacterized protein LOC135611708 n=1 Tax=Musa acuminata AAA Group TaxID=214697 RepID=UPI0031E014C4